MIQQLIGDASRFSQREASICFCWARMLVVDEVDNMVLNCCMTFTDFMEALGRVADLISPVEPQDMEKVSSVPHSLNICSTITHHLLNMHLSSFTQQNIDRVIFCN
jgi:hypothetical protein